MTVELLPKVESKGNLRLLDEPLTALFCSNRCPGDLILKTYDLARAMRDAGVPVIGGFQTPMERECLRLLLRGSQPVVVCPACGIDNMRIHRDWRTALDSPVRFDRGGQRTRRLAPVPIPEFCTSVLWRSLPTEAKCLGTSSELRPE